MNKARWFVLGGMSIYWLWHVLFVIVALAILLPFVALPIINSAFNAAAPWHYAIYVSIMVALPFLSIGIVWWRFRANAVAALKLFYAVELPLMLLLLLRVTLFRDAPFAAQFLLLNISIAIAAYFGMLWYSSAVTTPSGKQLGRVLSNIVLSNIALSTIVALVGVYLGLLLGIVFLPLALTLIVECWQGLINLSWATVAEFFRVVFDTPLIVIFVLLFFLTAVFFLVTPLLLIAFYLEQFYARLRKTPLPQLAVASLCVIVFETVIFSQSYQQSQLRAFELTESLPTDPIKRDQLLNEADTIREGLLSAYLAAYRYLSTTESSRSVKHSYQELLGEKSAIADFAQNLFNALASPFLYQGSTFNQDKTLAADRYQQFFDTPIEKAEKEHILSAVKATWENEQNEAGLMNAASHYVLLTDQSITVEEQGDLATISIVQVLENQTYQAQEIVFHFKLPEDAVVTGLWMSDDIQNPEKFRHVVSPRGAAQSVYKAEVRRRIDPALLEKVGPQQYRLRAFPIPARAVEQSHQRNRYSDAFKGFRVVPASVKFQYVVSIDKQGQWPMPTLLEKRNVYWNKQTKRSHATESIAHWLPETIATSEPNALLAHTTTMGTGFVQALPRDKQVPTKMPAKRFERPMAVIIDGSYSMNQVQDSLQKQLSWLQQSSINYDIFFCQLRCTKTEINALSKQVFFGNSQLLEQLSAWSTHEASNYASVFVLTDGGSYELSPDKDLPLRAPKQALWLIHLAQQLPYAYSDAVIDAVNDSGGGIAETITEAIDKFLWTQQVGQSLNHAKLIGVSKQYFWYWHKNADNINIDMDADMDIDKNQSSPFSALAAARWINHLAAKNDKSDLDNLDHIHSIAKQNDIVSFYSSMLVLVEDRQRDLLAEAESKEDRFEREIETGEEGLGAPTDPFSVPAVPEPEEWALLIIVGCLLLIAYKRQRNTADLVATHP
jgi:putative PEP-CTERM system integral membrane protein